MGVSAGSGGWHPADEHPVTMSLTPDKSKLRMDHRLTRKVETKSFSKESGEDAWHLGHTAWGGHHEPCRGGVPEGRFQKMGRRAAEKHLPTTYPTQTAAESMKRFDRDLGDRHEETSRPREDAGEKQAPEETLSVISH